MKYYIYNNTRPTGKIFSTERKKKLRKIDYAFRLFYIKKKKKRAAANTRYIINNNRRNNTTATNAVVNSLRAIEGR